MSEEPTYAWIVTRTVAITVDAALLVASFAIAGGVLGLILSLFTAVRVDSFGAAVSAVGAWTVFVVTYFAAFWSLAGETPGMRLMRVRVLGPDGRPPRFLRSMLRIAGMVIAAIPLFAGYLLILVDSRRRGLQDVIARTVVVYATAELPAPAPEPAPDRVQQSAAETIGLTRAV